MLGSNLKIYFLGYRDMISTNPLPSRAKAFKCRLLYASCTLKRFGAFFCLSNVGRSVIPVALVTAMNMKSIF